MADLAEHSPRAMSLDKLGRGVSWVSHRRESSLSTIPSASPPSTRTSFSLSSSSSTTPEVADEAAASPASQNEGLQRERSDSNDSSLKSLYGIRTVAMSRQSSQRSKGSSASGSIKRTKSRSLDLGDDSQVKEEDDAAADQTPTASTSRPASPTSQAQSSTESLSIADSNATEPRPSSSQSTAVQDTLPKTPPLYHMPVPPLPHEQQQQQLNQQQRQQQQQQEEEEDRHPFSPPPASSSSIAECLSPEEVDTQLPPPQQQQLASPFWSSARPSTSRRSSVVQMLQHKRRMASAPYNRPVAAGPHDLLPPHASSPAVSASPSYSSLAPLAHPPQTPLPPQHNITMSSPKTGGGLELPPGSPLLPGQSSPLPFYARSGRRTRSRQPSRSNSELHLNSPPMGYSASFGDLRRLSTESIMPHAPNEVVMTPTTGEWKSYGGKVGSSRFTLRPEPGHHPVHEEGDAEGQDSSSDSSDAEQEQDQEEQDQQPLSMHHRQRHPAERSKQAQAQAQTNKPRPPQLSSAEVSKAALQPSDQRVISPGLALLDAPALNRTTSQEHTNQTKGPVPLDSTGPVDPSRYSAITGLRSIDSFAVQAEAGRGAYGSVVHATERATGIPVIIKYIIKQRILADCWKKHKVLGPIPVEVHVLDQLRRIPYASLLPPHAGQGPPPITGHPNLCSLLDFWEDEETYYLCMPVFGGGQDLFDRVDECPSGLPVNDIANILAQVSAGVAFLHVNGIVHRDIKDENVILDGVGNAALIDFGSAAYVKEGQLFDTFSGTLDFAAPEVLHGQRYDARKTDVWALGVLAYVLICGECPFWDSSDAVQGLRTHTRAASALQEKLSENPRLEQVVDLVRRCLEVDASERPGAADICQHAFFSVNGWQGKFGWHSSSVQGQQA